ncbi:flagellar motor switch phosphatase FliY [Clostridium sartagoforme]|uniref:Flagellar motor switch phosphatase FliY n=1 Tax=Clostridium sartagoforme TaxID=84031 RepID=A0A4S2DPN2_9CLOT|nr:flagellar motor switch phosphatase FliY [Clostridium sartagoforme]TGY43772.1 flagellar motor switch phosphatase FliY [Clostridium sartagoforme]
MSNGFLSQEEIDSLLNGSPEPSNDTSQFNGEGIISELERDLLGEIGNISMGSASTALYQLINKPVNITTPKVTVTTLKAIKEAFKYPNIILDVKYVSGITGRNILIMQTTDAAVIANLMMGGDGKISNAELSELEVSAVQEAMNQMIGSAATSMATMFAREVNISPPKSKIWKDIGEEISDSIPEDEPIVEICFDLMIEGLLQSNMMQILPIDTAKKIVSIMMGEEEQSDNGVVSSAIDEAALDITYKEPTYGEPNHYSEGGTHVNSHEVYQEPRPLQEPIIQQPVPVQPERPVEVHGASFEALGQGPVGESHRNIDLILDVPLEVSVVLGRTKKSIKDILNLSTGSLIELEKLAEEPVEVLVNGKKIAYGEVVVVDENFGVRITSIVSGAERIKSLK